MSDARDERRPTIKKGTLKRRDFLKLATAAGLGAVAVNYGLHAARDEAAGGRRIEVTDNCIGCTGCAVVCPTLAIAVVPGGIAAADDLCIRCGYCQAACAVDGIRVLRQGA